jgi:hypothetical protein
LRKVLVLHPFLFSLYAPLALLSVNIQEMVLSDAWRTLAVCLAVAAMLLLGTVILLRDVHAAGVLATQVLVLLLSYGHVYDLAKNAQIGGLVVGRHRYLLVVWASFLLIGFWLILQRRQAMRTWTRVLNVTSLLLILMPIGSLANYAVGTMQSGTPVSMAYAGEAERASVSRRDAPDIYYIILDTYPRADTLQDWWGYDNSAFVEGLEQRGFFVADESNANYFGTGVSLASSLNLDYLQNLGIDLTQGIYPSNLAPAIMHSRVRTYLEDRGYSVVAFPTNYDPTILRDADYYLEPGITQGDRLQVRRSINEFEVLAARTTILSALIDLDVQRTHASSAFLASRLDEPREYRRQLVLATFTYLGDVPEIAGPKFIFAHIGSPHQPYVFRADGSEIPEAELANRQGDPLSDHNSYFTDQVTYISSLTLEAIDEILASSKTRPIILLQADHGPDLGFDWTHPDGPRLRARMAILNAYYIPEECRSELYSDITPVNSFRVIFNCAFGAEFEMLDDLSYYSVLRGPASGRLKFQLVDSLLSAQAP